MGGGRARTENGAITRSGVEGGGGCYVCLSTGAVIRQEHGLQIKIRLYIVSEQDHCLGKEISTHSKRP